MRWTVLLHDSFEAELHGLAEDRQDELLAHARLLARFGPHLGRPHVDTLKGSRHANMKELRFDWNGGSGALRSRSTRGAMPCCSWAATRRARSSAGFISA